MPRKKSRKIRKISREELSSALGRAKENLDRGDYEIFEAVVETLEFITEKLEEKNVRLKQMLKQILGIKSEKSSKVIERIEMEESKAEVEVLGSSPSSNGDVQKETPPKKRKGHGRNGSEKYTGAKNVRIAHSDLESGHSCPGCVRGKVYQEKKPGVFIHIEARPPIDATVYETEKLRCNLCGEIFEADLPVEAPAKKHYDETAKSMMAVLRYGHGLPLNRLEKLQASFGIPLPAATAWDKTKEAAEKIFPVHQELTHLAAQGEIIHSDDTGMKILKTMKEIEEEAKKAKGKKTRRGIFTTGIVSIINSKKITLFFTGRKHAGENFDDLLKGRESDRSPPLQMCDAKTGNKLKSTSAIVCNCNAHARRYFVDVSENFPEECTYVILKVYKKIYKHDACTKEEEMSPKERLEYHQKKSKPIMDKFHTWLKRQFEKKLVEENSGLGKAISYTLNHWSKLTQFLHIAGAPLDNNICEQTLKRAICHRKNSLFYKTLDGARVGDMFMSLIHTCYYAGVNPFDYFTQLQRNSEQVAEDPSKWLPWNYPTQLQSLN